MGLELFETLRNSRMVKGVRPSILRWIKRGAEDFRYWTVSHTKRIYHKLDLRQPMGLPDRCCYRWGWIDSDWQIEFAVGNILCNFIEKEYGGEDKFEERVKWLEGKAEKHAKENDSIGVHLSNGEAEWDRKILKLYRWWKYERIELAKKYQEAQSGEDINASREEFDRGGTWGHVDLGLRAGIIALDKHVDATYAL
jgi:hypothetical protein